jgi:hypothetical protein
MRTSKEAKKKRTFMWWETHEFLSKDGKESESESIWSRKDTTDVGRNRPSKSYVRKNERNRHKKREEGTK